ncbi:stAR-related lipid transfer protein 7, mitochondrial isoform X1 [Prunus persica]|uniref:stAR-related lipid transfer protein 7, mitochondrial isoform X1 n=1 Tax=Prunus persica TaxID=3760 RepID=UPI0009AB39EA|nr:stAR-related lipid transfer protein 7, mitochondrial isoform X1 [Prunus persica]
MIAQLALALLCLVAAWMPLVCLSLLKGWSWSRTLCSWRLTFPTLSFSSHRHREISSESVSRPRLTATTFSGQCCTHPHHEQECSELNEDDVKVLVSHIDETDGGPPWKLMMERSTPTLTYQAWYRDPPLGPTQYRTRTVFENVSPELLRNFFWDDEFRPQWDNTLIHFQTLRVCPKTGSMTVHWIRKLPLFCSDREYVITRRIWESDSGYYCLTKGTPYPPLPRSKRPRRVDHYYSSWHIKSETTISVKPRNGEQHKMASEVLLFHHEDIGLPREVVKMGVRAGMWSLVKRLHLGLQTYQMAKENDGSPSNYALMANITTKIKN